MVEIVINGVTYYPQELADALELAQGRVSPILITQLRELCASAFAAEAVIKALSKSEIDKLDQPPNN